MVYQHKDYATPAMRDARRILNCWWREGLAIAPLLSPREVTVDEYLDAYSDHVALAAVLAGYRLHIATSHAYSGQLVNELYCRVETVFADRCGSSRAIERVSDQRLTMRRPTGPIARLFHPTANTC